MEDRVGAYIIDQSGNVVPDMTDEAMKKRHSTKDADGKKKKEVKRDGVSEQSTDISKG